MTLRAFLLSSAAVLVPGVVLAQGAFELDDAVITSNIIETAPNRTGATVEVLTSDDLTTAPVAVQETLQTLPGVTAVQTGGFGTESTVSIRGLNEYYIGVTYDGIEVTDPSAPQNAFPFGQLARSAVGRIEIAKGTQSAAYGSDAIAGALNIESWRPTKDGLSFNTGVEVGSRDSAWGALSVGFLDDRTELAFTISRSTTSGYAARINDDEVDGFQQTLLNFAFERDVTETVTLGATAFFEDSFLDIDGSEGNPLGFTDATRRGARLFARIDGDAVDHEIGISTFRSVRDEDGGFGFGVFPFEGERRKIEYIGSTRLSDRTDLSFGADWSEETSVVGTDENSADNTGLFAEATFTLSPATDISASLRQDFYSDVDDALTGRVAAVHRAGNGLTIRGTLGTGYRAASLNERFGFGGDPDFSPEESIGGDVSVTKEFGSGFVEAAVFYTEIDDLIQFNRSTFSYFQSGNTGVSQGVELSGQIDIGSYSLAGAYTFTDAEVDGSRLVRVPEHDLYVSLGRSLGERWNADLGIRHVANLTDVDASNAIVDLDDYTVANATLTYDVNADTEAYIRVENLFDEDYQSILGFDAPGRGVFVGLSAQF